MISLILFLFHIAMHGTLRITSPAFDANNMIPSKYTCTGQGINPEINISDIPAKTKTLALIMDDPDAPNGGFVHWVMYNIPVQSNINENSAPGTEGNNGKKENKYAGPCPPSGTHHYHFKVYALDADLSLSGTVDKKVLEKAMEGHIVAKGELIGLYKK